MSKLSQAAAAIIDEFDEQDFTDAYAEGDPYREQDAATAYQVLTELAEEG